MKDNRRKASILITSITLVIVLLIGVTYAYFSSTANTSARTVQAGTLRIQYETDALNTVRLNNISPIYDADMTTKASKISFTVTNTGTSNVYVSINLTDIVINNELKNSDFKWALYSGNTKVSDGNFVGATSPMSLIKNEQIASTNSKAYQLYIWISETGTDQSIMMDRSFSAKIMINASQYSQQEENQQSGTLLTQKIIEDNSPLATILPNFDNIANTDEGLITDTDSDGTTYYFRGAVDDNYLKIQGLTWGDSNEFHNAGDDVLFRIVRINGSGTTRIIMNEPIGSTAFNINSNNEKYVGYTYDNGKSCTSSSPCTSNTGTPSTIKDYLENSSTGWYTNNIAYYDNILATERYCYDTSVSRTGGGNIYYRAYGRLYTNKTPQFVCPNTSKTYGGEYNLKVGLLTADEVVFAGGKLENENDNYYLAGSSWWVGSPYRLDADTGTASTFFVNNNILNNKTVDITDGAVKPVFNLKSDIIYSSGNGTSSNPYVVNFATPHQITANSFSS